MGAITIMENEIIKYREMLDILQKHLKANFYKTGQYHNDISNAMEEYHQKQLKTLNIHELNTLAKVTKADLRFIDFNFGQKSLPPDDEISSDYKVD